MSCEKACYEATIETCNDIVVKAGLTASTPFYWIIRKASSSNIIQRLTATNADGDLTIAKADLPAGYLIKGNHYKIEVRNGSNYLQKVPLTFGAEEYQCVIAQLVGIDRESDDGSQLNVIEYKVS